MTKPKAALSIAQRKRRQLLGTRSPIVKRTLTAADREDIRAMIDTAVALKMSGFKLPLAGRQGRGGCG